MIDCKQDYDEALDRLSQLYDEHEISEDIYEQDAILDEIQDLEEQIDEYISAGLNGDPYEPTDEVKDE